MIYLSRCMKIVCKCCKRPFFGLIFIVTIAVYTTLFMRKDDNVAIIEKPGLSNFGLNRFETNQKNEIYQNNQWLFNNNIFQYSVYLIRQSNSDKVRIESIVLSVDFDIQIDNVLCALRQQNGVWKLHRVLKSFMFTENLGHPSGSIFGKMYKIICEYQVEQEFDDHSSSIAIIEKDRYKPELKDFDGENKIFSYSHMHLQIPKIIDARLAKQKKIAHCVHTVYDLDVITTAKAVIPGENKRFQSMVHFLNMQFDLGIDIIRIYIKRQRANTDFLLSKKYQDKNLSILHYPLSYAEICKKQIDNKEKYADSMAHDYLLKQCQNGYMRYFQAITVSGTWTMHEKITTNDCFINFKYTHEYVTNYDFDELILPHGSAMGHLQANYDNMSSSDTSVCQHKPVNFDLYEHTANLFNKNQAAAVLFLSHVVMVPFESSLTEFFDKLDKHIQIDNFSGSLMVSYKQLTFTVSNNDDAVYAKELVRLYRLAYNINQKYLNNDKIAFNFNRAVAINIPIRGGKSIYKTELCEILNVHNADVAVGSITNVNQDSSFTSHFREEVETFLVDSKLQYSIKFIYIDIEYYHFVVRKYSGLDCALIQNKL